MADIKSINGNPIVVGASGIEDNAVTAAKLAQGAVTTAKLAEGAVTDAKLAQSGGVLEKVDDLESAIDTKAPAIIGTASGAIASFDDGADDMPVKKLVVNIEPVQDLHGYDSPWPAGRGKNKLKVTVTTQTQNGVTFTVSENGIITVNGTASELTDFKVAQYEFGSDIMFLSGCPANGSTSTYFLWVLGHIGLADTGSGAEQTSVFGNKYVAIRITKGTTVSNLVFKPMLRLATETDATFAPYENLCPISGWTGAEIEQTGVNIWDEEWELGGIDTKTGNNTASANHVRSKNYIPVKGGESYNLHMPWASIIYYDANKVFLRSGVNAVTEDGAVHDSTIAIDENVAYIRFRCSGTYGTTYDHDISINYPATDTDYHPYSGNQISVTFPSEAGTVYGGTLDVTNGKLTVDRAMVDLGTLTWTKNASSMIGLPCFYAVIPGVNSGAAYFNCSEYAIKRYRSEIDDTAQIAPGNTTDATYCVVRDDRYADSSEAEFKAAASGVQLVYQLATPQTYQLTPQEVRTLLGTNNIWADTGDVEVTYPADTKLYIDSKITQAIANALNS